MNKVCIITYTENGRMLFDRISQGFSGEMKVSLVSDDQIEELWSEAEAFIFICAVGIAVRKIAPFLKDKLEDPAVLVIDELGLNVIPILSGHVGGANELARRIERKLNIRAVITTATDINGVLAIDEWAVRNDLKINEKSGIKKTAMKLLKGEKVNISFSKDVIVSSKKEDSKECDLWLEAEPAIVAGIGCRKGKNVESLIEFLEESFEEAGLDIDKLFAIASIDIKENEEGLVELARKYGVPFITYSANELSKVKGDFEKSEFVEKTVGVSDVSARAAKLCGGAGSFVIKKKKQDGMTLSLFEKYKTVSIWYEED